MYQIEKPQIGCRLSESEFKVINDVLVQLQDKTGSSPTSMREALMLIVTNVDLTEKLDESSTNDNTDNRVLFEENAKKEFMQHAVNVGVNTDNAIDIGQLTNIAASITPDKDPEKIEVEVEKEVLVDRDLKENEFIVSLSEDQHKVATQVQKNREDELKKQGSEGETIPELFKNCFFNEGVIKSFGGGWWTGL